MARYYPQLDALRAIAVALVLLSHFLVGGPWGDYGVRLFFVLSGFLITSTLLQHRDHMRSAGVPLGLVARNFYMRRALRLFPVYYVALLAFAVLAAQGLAKPLAPADWLFHAAYLTNVLVFVRNEWQGALSPYWSLAVEEQFYLLWFWLVICAPRRWLLPLLLLSVLAAPMFRWFSFAIGQPFYADVLLPACVDTLAAGALLALMLHEPDQPGVRILLAWLQRHRQAVRRLLGLAVVALLALSFGADKNSLPRRLMVNLLASAVFVHVIYAAHRGIGGRIGRLMSQRWLIDLGRISYGMYVYHMLVLQLCRAWLVPRLAEVGGVVLTSGSRVVLEAVAATVLTLAVAKLSWHLLETPVLRLKRRFSDGVAGA